MAECTITRKNGKGPASELELGSYCERPNKKAMTIWVTLANIILFTSPARPLDL